MKNQILFFNSETCQPCALAKKLLTEEINNNLNIVSIDVANNYELAIEHKVMSVPMFVKIVNKKETNRLKGFNKETFLEDLQGL